jgi:coenzyme F420-0:L-glutamate ligase / coenzyme F420-1:gamma-L-glutamate ligase
MRLEISALTSIPEVRPGDDLVHLIQTSASGEHEPIDSLLVVAVAQKIVSKAENAIVDLRQVTPSKLARSWAERWGKDSRLIETILSNSKRIVKMDRGVIISETHHGFVCANAGVDQSNTEGDDFATVLPEDPDASARKLRSGLGCGAVIVTDTFGRPWREGLVDVAIGVAGLEAIEDRRGTLDRRGRKLAGTIIAVADQLAATAGILMAKSSGRPVVVIRGFTWQGAEGSGRTLIRSADQDLFR